MFKVILVVIIALAIVGAGVAMAQESKNAGKSPDQIAWEKAIPKRLAKRPAFAYQEDTPLPNVLIIGDSISIGYTAAVRKMLAGKADVFRIPTNGGDTDRGLKSMDKWLGDRKWDVITINWGLHDLKYLKGRKLDMSGKQVRGLEDYAANLEKIVQRLEKTGAKIIWVSTTPVPEGSNGRKKGDAAKYNEVAAGVMKKHGIPTVDLYSFALPQLDKIQRPKNVHFTDKGSEALAGQVVAQIEKALP